MAHEQLFDRLTQLFNEFQGDNGQVAIVYQMNVYLARSIRHEAADGLAFLMGGSDHRMNIAAWLEVPFDRDFEGIAGGNHVIQNLIHRGFMAGGAIAIAVDVEF